MAHKAATKPIPTAMLPANALDDWLGGFVVFWVVTAALAGGALSAGLVFGSPNFKSAVDRSPLVLAWGILLGADGALAWAGLFPALGACWNGLLALRASGRKHLIWIFATIAAITAAVATLQWLSLGASPSSVEWPLGNDQGSRMTWATVVIFVPVMMAIVGMWFTAVQIFDSLDKTVLDRHDVANFLELRERLQNLFWFVGIVIAGAMLATGTLRQALIDGDYTTKETFPAFMVVAYGTVITLLLIVSYVPPHILIQRTGTRLVHYLARGDDLHAWNEDRRRLIEDLDLGVSLQNTVKNLLAILAPILAGLASVAFPDK
jgi:hypothetical protein